MADNMQPEIPAIELTRIHAEALSFARSGQLSDDSRVNERTLAFKAGKMSEYLRTDKEIAEYRHFLKEIIKGEYENLPMCLHIDAEQLLNKHPKNQADGK